MRKIVAAALAVGMAAMTVTGCSSSKSESKETTKATAEVSKETQKETEKAKQKFFKEVTSCLIKSRLSLSSPRLTRMKS